MAITGAPGVGKSTFIEHFGYYLLGKGHRLAVLAVDPSSPLFKGSILGDKTRMHQLSQEGEVYIRPSSAGAILGGVSKGTKEAIFLCEAAGYDTILVETVGVGQSEAWASMMTDFTLLLIQPGAGDEIQGIKRGILEMADLIIVNKADGEQNDLALKTARAYAQAMTLFQPRYEAFKTSVLTASSLEEKGFDAIYRFAVEFHAFLLKETWLEKVRADQEVFWFDANVRERIMQAVMHRLDFSAMVTTLRDRIQQEHTPSFLALYEIDRLIQNRLDT
ncbi:MAG: methylmalonyl Co-A mutase-associated GTPase MeaB [Saprospiraceae bacterium]|nr:methylmalonyl Co-A mutase-associated GTPase MeaB [Saprospiraceae bacterium]